MLKELLSKYCNKDLFISNEEVQTYGFNKSIYNSFCELTGGRLKPCRILEDELESKLVLVFEEQAVLEYLKIEIRKGVVLVPYDDLDEEEIDNIFDYYSYKN